MRLSSDLLARLVQATGKQPGIDALAFRDTQIPNVLTPVFRAVGPLSRFAGFSTTDVNRESTMATLNVAQPASTAAATGVLITLGKGLWNLALTLNCAGSYTDVASSTALAQLQLQDPGGATQRKFVTFVPIANVPQSWSGAFDLLLMDDSWQVQLVSGATGAGQTHVDFAHAIASRLA